MTVVLIAGYAVFCVLVGVCGRYRRLGFGPAFVLAIILTPPVMLLALFLFGPKQVATPPQPR